MKPLPDPPPRDGYDVDATLASLDARVADLIANRARVIPNALAIRDTHDGRTWTYAALADEIDRAAVALSQLGVRAGDRVAIVQENGIASAALFLAATRLDAWGVLLNARLTHRELSDICAHAEPRRVLYATANSNAAREHASDAADTSEIEIGSLDGVFASPENTAANPEPPPADPADTIAMLLYTSGTTGNPKAVMLSHRGLLYCSRIVRERRAYEPGDCAALIAPMAHILGMGGITLPAFDGGAAIELYARFDPPALLASLAAGHVTRLYGAPPMYPALLDQGDGEKIHAPALREVFAGGAPTEPALRARVEAAFGLPLSAGYAATECSPIAASLPSRPGNIGAAGEPWHGIELKIIDENGVPVADGEAGSIHVRGPNTMVGYYKDPELTAEVKDPRGWVDTGDIGKIDADGQIHVLARTKEVILRSGFSVYPLELEVVLTAHPAVSQAAVVGRTVRDNEEAVAFVRLATGEHASVDDLDAWARERLAAYKRPNEIVLVDELPTIPSGKIDKAALRKEAAVTRPKT